MINVYRPPAGKIGQIVKETFSSVIWMQLSKIKGFLVFLFSCSLSTFWLTIEDMYGLVIIFSIDSQDNAQKKLDVVLIFQIQIMFVNTRYLKMAHDLVYSC